MTGDGLEQHRIIILEMVRSRQGHCGQVGLLQPGAEPHRRVIIRSLYTEHGQSADDIDLWLGGVTARLVRHNYIADMDLKIGGNRGESITAPIRLLR